MALINFLLNVIPIFFMSFLEMLVEVWKKLVQIQRRFLWGGVKGESKISWVSWVDICKSNSKGSLGARDLHMVNLALLDKWIWCFISSASGLWKYVICFPLWCIYCIFFKG